MTSSRTILLSDLSPGSCVFCDDEDSLRSMHRTYHHDGQPENYTAMLLLCFNIKVAGLDYEDTESEICETCVDRLRDALSFRKLIEAVDETFYDQLSIEIPQKQCNNAIKLDDSDAVTMTESQHDLEETLSDHNYDVAEIGNANNQYITLDDIINETSKRKKDAKRKNMNIDDITIEEITEMLGRNRRERKKVRKEKEHIPPALDPTATQCPICNDKFSVPRSLARHYATHFPNYICDVCGKAWLKKQNLDVHLKTHLIQKIICDICNKTYSNRSALSQHIRIKHKGEKVYSCKFCSEKFSDNGYRNKHLSDVHGEPARVYPCPTCNKTYFRSSKLWVHIKRDHHQQRNYTCVQCDSQFFSKNGLDNHMLRHTGEKRFRCEVCGKAYGRKNTLVEHMKIHADIRAYKCDDCGKAFIQKCTLKTHMSSQHPSKAERLI